MNDKEKPGWNVFKDIFSDHWEGFKREHSRYDTNYYNELVQKMLSCGNPEEMGYIEYLCQSCGRGRRLVSMSCKSTLSVRCGKVYVDNWVSQVSKMLDGECVNENKPFFELGVTSINVASTVEELEKQLQITLEVTDVFNYPTIQKFAEYIETQFQSKADKYTEEKAQQLVPLEKKIMGGNRYHQAEHDLLDLETILTKVYLGTLDIEEALELINQ
ncbi:MAG: hypothetical protein GY941_06770 [Planctomycetes bacterium]|nr:hypothetical protein [Planctomycetota bacterium]